MGRPKSSKGRGENVSIYIRRPGLAEAAKAQAERLGMNFSEFTEEALWRLMAHYRPDEMPVRDPVEERAANTVDRSIEAEAR
jgi:hypothetical protein